MEAIRSWAFWLLVWAILLTPSVVAQQWALTYGGSGDDTGVSIQPTTPDGGYVVAGDSLSFGGSRDIWVVKLSPAGIQQWEKVYGGGDRETAAAIQQTNPDGGYIVAGTTDSFGAGESDIWLVKLDPLGNVEWERTLGGAGSDSAVAVQQTTPDGGYIVAGTTDSFGAGQSDFWVVKVDAAGTPTWQRTYGGVESEIAASISRTNDGGYVLAGETYSFDVGNGDFWLLKLDSAGIVQWERAYGLFLGNENIESSPQVRQTDDGGYILAGTSAPLPAGNTDAWLLKLDAVGTVQWQKVYETLADYEVTSIEQTADLGYVLAGRKGSLVGVDVDSDGWIAKLNTAGDLEWQNSYGDSSPTAYDSIAAAHPLPGGGLIAVGGTESYGMGGQDLWVLSLDATGEVSSCLAVAPWAGSEADTLEAGIDSAAVLVETAAVVTMTAAASSDTQAFRNDGCSTRTDLIMLPKTGQSVSYYPGDDGDLQTGVAWPSPRFTDHLDGTVTDTLTGLMWLADANCAATIGFDPAGTGDGQMDWQTALDFVAGINDGTHDISACAGYTASYTDWRLANGNSLESLMHGGENDRATWLNGQGFANVQNWRYWTSTSPVTFPPSPFVALTVEVDTSRVIDRGKHLVFHVWPVRAGQQLQPDPAYPANVWKTGQTDVLAEGDDGEKRAGVAWPTARFSDNLDGTVSDNLTGLMWLKDSDCFPKELWEPALDVVADFNLNPVGYGCFGYTASYSDWALPNKKQLLSLADRSLYPALPEGHPFVNVALGGYHWSSTTDTMFNTQAWGFFIPAGTMQILSKAINDASIWPVRVPMQPRPDIKANGSDGPLFVGAGESVNLTIELDAAGEAGRRADWWGLLFSARGSQPLFSFQASLADLGPTSLFDLPLPVGLYVFVFNVDGQADLAFQTGWLDVVVVVVTSSEEGEAPRELPDLKRIIPLRLEGLTGK